MLRSTDYSSLHELRLRLRQRRNALSTSQKQSNSLAITETLIDFLSPYSKQQIAAYSAFDGEPCLDPLIEKFGDRVWLPVISANTNDMIFAKGQPKHRNRFGISEPLPTETPQAVSFGAILVPLVGFDWNCNRLGMGKGFYDRALANIPPNTLFIGVAHSCQQVDSLQTQVWDVPLNCVVTETGIIFPPS